MMMYESDDEINPFLNNEEAEELTPETLGKKIKKQVLNFSLKTKPFKLRIICSLLSLLTMSIGLFYLLLPYVGWNFIFIRNYCFWPFSGESFTTFTCNRICKPHPLGGQCYYDTLGLEVMSILRETLPNQQFYLGKGNLLAWHREGKLTFCNDDFDIILHNMYRDKFTWWEDWKFQNALLDHGLVLWNTFWIYRVCRINYAKTTYSGEPCTVDLFPSHGTYMNEFAYNWTKANGNFEFIEIENTIIPIPEDRIKMFENYYGQDYMTPLEPNREDNCLEHLTDKN